MFEDIIRLGVVLASLVPSAALGLAAMASFVAHPESFERRLARQIRKTGLAYVRRPRFAAPGGGEDAFAFAVKTQAGIVFIDAAKAIVGDVVRVERDRGRIVVSRPAERGVRELADPAVEAQARATEIARRERWLSTPRTVAVIPGRGCASEDAEISGFIAGPERLARTLSAMAAGEPPRGSLDIVWNRVKAVADPSPSGAGILPRARRAIVCLALAVGWTALMITVWQSNAF